MPKLERIPMLTFNFWAVKVWACFGGQLAKLYVHITVDGRRLPAKIDTGAERTALDWATATELKLGPALYHKKIEGESRPIVEFRFRFRDKTHRVEASLSDRHEREFKVLLGMDFVEASGLGSLIRRWLDEER